MNIQEKIASIIKGRPCFVLAKGKTLEELERKINHYKDLDVCWVTLNDFKYLEDKILSKINKKFDLISTCASVENIDIYERTIRLPRFKEYLERPVNNLLMLSNIVIEHCFKNTGNVDIYEKYKEKIVIIEELFSSPNCPKEIFDKPPNSITLLYAFLMAGGAKEVFIFGLDGLKPGIKWSESYYDSPSVLAHRQVSHPRMPNGQVRINPGSLVSDSVTFNIRWNKIFEIYKKSFNNSNVKFYNVNPDSMTNHFKKITHDQILDAINGTNDL